MTTTKSPSSSCSDDDDDKKKKVDTNSFSSHLRKTFLLYDDLPTKKVLKQRTKDNNDKTIKEVLLTDAVMPDKPEDVTNLATKLKKFPNNFMYGTATAAYQVEGGLENCNWYEWEQQQFRLPYGDGQPTVINHEQANRACDSWNLFLERDLPAMTKLGNVGMYRFSIEWSRIEPKEGQFDFEVIQRYQSWCHKLLEHNIEPMITLHHFTEPTWFVQKGGWEIRDNIPYFERFVKYVTQHLLLNNNNNNNDRVLLCRYWSTINELNGYAICGWLAGVHPPGKVNDVWTLLKVIHHLLLAHAAASRIIHATYDINTMKLPEKQNEEKPIVNLPLNHVLFLPSKSSSSFSILSWFNYNLSKFVSIILNYAYNFLILDAIFFGHLPRLLPFPFQFLGKWLLGETFSKDIQSIHGTSDWIGINHYYRSYVEFRRLEETTNTNEKKQQASPTDMFVDLPWRFQLRAAALPNFEKNEMGWDLTPSSMKCIVEMLWDRYQPIPMIITESGCADHTDQKRVRYIYGILSSLQELMNSPQNVDLRGYLIWTLLDNFEWAEGFHPKFGILQTNFTTMERIERKLTCDLLRCMFPSSSKKKEEKTQETIVETTTTTTTT